MLLMFLQKQEEPGPTPSSPCAVSGLFFHALLYLLYFIENIINDPPSYFGKILSSSAAAQSEDEIRTSSPIQQDTPSVCQNQLEGEQCSPSKPQTKEPHTDGEDSMISEVIIISCIFHQSKINVIIYSLSSRSKPI